MVIKTVVILTCKALNNEGYETNMVFVKNNLIRDEGNSREGFPRSCSLKSETFRRFAANAVIASCSF